MPFTVVRMAYAHVKTWELFEGGRGHSFSLPIDIKYRRIFKALYAGDTAILLDPGWVRVNTPNIPTMLSVYPNDTRALLLNIDVEQQEDNPYLWKFVCDYKTNFQASQPVNEAGQADENPLNRPAEISVGFQQFRRIVSKDISNKDITNSAGDFFDPPIEADDSRPTITIRKNKASVNLPLIMAYKDAINSDGFLNFPPYSLKIMAQEANRAFENNLTYWVQSLTVQANPDSWWFFILDQGYRKINTGGVVVPIIDFDGQRPSRPVLLDGSGHILNEFGGTAAAYFHTKRVYKELPFAALGMT